MGFRSRLFHIYSDYQVSEAYTSFQACGCGGGYALGSLYTSMEWSDPKERVLHALRAAEAYSAGVRAPFTVLHIRNGTGQILLNRA